MTTFDFAAHLERQRDFSLRTFGPGVRTKGVCDHIRKELIEVEDTQGDLSEWIDVIILGLDGALRSGATPAEVIKALVSKQTKNEGRTWPDWRAADLDKAIEHVRTGSSQPAMSTELSGMEKAFSSDVWARRDERQGIIPSSGTRKPIAYVSAKLLAEFQRNAAAPDVSSIIMPIPFSSEPVKSSANVAIYDEPNDAHAPISYPWWSPAIRDVMDERGRQVVAEGFTPEHDGEHTGGEMAGAAACYAMFDIMHWGRHYAIQTLWPWSQAWWKPTDRRRNLVKAAALIVAEIERLDRAGDQT